VEENPVTPLNAVVSRLGIEPRTRRLRGSQASKPIAADPEKSRKIGVGCSSVRPLVVDSGRVVRNPWHKFAHAVLRLYRDSFLGRGRCQRAPVAQLDKGTADFTRHIRASRPPPFGLCSTFTPISFRGRSPSLSSQTSGRLREWRARAAWASGRSRNLNTPRG
jgi:hypothetical protein